MEDLEQPNIEEEQIQKKEESKMINEKKNDRRLPFIIGLIIGLIIGIIISTYIMNLPSEDKPEIPIYEQFEVYRGEDLTIFRNGELNVSVTLYWEDAYTRLYYAEYTDIHGNYAITSTYGSEKALLDEVLLDQENLSDNQLRWFADQLKLS